MTKFKSYGFLLCFYVTLSGHVFLAFPQHPLIILSVQILLILGNPQLHQWTSSYVVNLNPFFLSFSKPSLNFSRIIQFLMRGTVAVVAPSLFGFLYFSSLLCMVIALYVSELDNRLEHSHKANQAHAAPPGSPEFLTVSLIHLWAEV